MNDSENSAMILEIRRMVHEILGEIRQMKRHRNMLGGSPILEFDEVCSMLHFSERQVRRLRETGQLVGFVFNRRYVFAERGYGVHSQYGAGSKEKQGRCNH